MRIKLGLLILLMLTVTGCNKKQEIIFEVQSVSYENQNSIWSPEIQQACIILSKELKGYLNDGWRVVTSSPKEKLVTDNKGTCIGTEYVLEK